MELDEFLQPLRKEFETSGVTEEEFIEQITAARKGYRNSR